MKVSLPRWDLLRAMWWLNWDVTPALHCIALHCMMVMMMMMMMMSTTAWMYMQVRDDHNNDHSWTVSPVRRLVLLFSSWRFDMLYVMHAMPCHVLGYRISDICRSVFDLWRFFWYLGVITGFVIDEGQDLFPGIWVDRAIPRLLG
jgi:hypothetical protein